MFDTIIGHGTVLRLLEAWAKKPANGYIFLGPAQVGKRTVAEQFIFELLAGSRKQEAGNPTELPASSFQLRASSFELPASSFQPHVVLRAHPDLVVLDVPEGKKEIPVELVRQARLQLAGRPMVAPRRALFIPRADRLNEEGVNVLLKVVEEPPAGAVCVAIIEDLSRLPGTLQSRMVKVPFYPVPRQEIEAGLITRGVSSSEAARLAGECRGRPGRIAGRWKREDGLPPSIFPFPSSSCSLGEWLEVIDRATKQCEGAEDAQAAWSNFLDEWSEGVRALLAAGDRRALVLGQGILTARHFVGGALSPRLPLEAAVTRLDNLNIFPTHLGTAIPRLFEP